MSEENYNQTTRSVQLTLKEFDELAKVNCSCWDPFSKQQYYRGIRETRSYFSQAADKGNFLYLDPNKFKRRSIEDEDIHVTMLDIHPDYENFPKYSKSVIGTTAEKIEDIRLENKYGKIYVIIPYDDSKIGVFREADVWECFGTGMIQGWDSYLKSNYDFWNGELREVENLEDLRNLLISKEMLPGRGERDLKGLLDKFSIENSEMSTTTPRQHYFNSSGHGNCCYFGGPVLMVSLQKFYEYRFYLKQETKTISETSLKNFGEWRISNGRI